jgi:hypothetical protein
VPQPRAARLPANLGRKELASEYGKLSGRANSIDRMELLLRVFFRAERIAGSAAFTPLDEAGDVIAQRDRFFIELRGWWNSRNTHRTYVLGKEAPPGNSPEGYALYRVKVLAVPKDIVTLTSNYKRFNAAMGSKHPVPTNISIAEAHAHLITVVEHWALKRTTESAATQSLLSGLFNTPNRATQ